MAHKHSQSLINNRILDSFKSNASFFLSLFPLVAMRSLCYPLIPGVAILSEVKQIAIFFFSSKQRKRRIMHNIDGLTAK